MIRIMLVLLVVTALGWGVGHASRSSAPADEPPVSSRSGDFSAIQERMQSKVVLYTLSNCAYSQQAKALLDAHGIDYAELDVGESLDARQEAKSLGAVTVPYMLLGDIAVEGFDEARMLAWLDAQQAM